MQKKDFLILLDTEFTRFLKLWFWGISALKNLDTNFFKYVCNFLTCVQKLQNEKKHRISVKQCALIL